MKLLEGKTAIITGGSRGIGKGTAIALGEKGCTVYVTGRTTGDGDRTIDTTARLVAEAGGEGKAIQCDHGTDDDIATLFQQIGDEAGCIDILVNNAATNVVHPVLNHDDDAWFRVIDVNLCGPYLCTRNALPHLIKNGWGRIISIASTNAHVGTPDYSAYAASKAAVDSFSVGFAKEVGTQGIRVNVVRPGVTLTDMTSAVRDNADIRKSIESTIAMNRTAEADEMAAPILWLLSKEASFVSGASLDASGGGFLINASTSGK